MDSKTTRIFSSRGLDGLNRAEKRNLALYNRTQYLFDKFLAARKTAHTLELTHEHILDLGDKTLRKLELDKLKRLEGPEPKNNDDERIKREIEAYKEEIRNNYTKQFEEAKESMKNSYETLMKRIERQRDEAEEERVRDIMRRMSEECDAALRRQWSDAEAYRLECMAEMREAIRKEARDAMKAELDRAIREALENAEREYNMRLHEALERMRVQCQSEADERIKDMRAQYDASIEAFLFKLKQCEQKWKHEKERREKFESDFRLLQADYKRFMNYTDHYNSDYMMKLRHIGATLLLDNNNENDVSVDDEYEAKLNERIARL